MTDFAMPEQVQPPNKHVGRRTLRRENLALLTGKGEFVDDLPVKPGTLHAAFLRSPHPHAEIVSIDCSALKMSGVHAVVTGKDLAERTDPMLVGFQNPIDYYGMATNRVRYMGEPVAAVAATDRYLAEDAVEAIKVEYRPLAAVVDPLQALAPDAPLLHPRADSNCVSTRHFIHGAPEEAFAQADHGATLTIRYPRNSITPMETYAVVAEAVAETGGFDVLSNFQGPFSLHSVMTRALRVRSNALRLRSPKNSGGSFGSKLTIFPYIVVLCVLAGKAKRPVKWIEDRLEHLSAASSAANRVTKIEAAYTEAGKITALRLTHWDDNGAYLRAPMPAPLYRMHGVSTNGYDIRNLEVTNHVVVTNKCPSGAVRGFGGPQLYFAVERMMQKVASELGMDPLELVRRNLIRPEQFPYQAIAGALLDSGNYQRVIEEASAAGDLDRLKQRKQAALRAGKLYGVGYAACVEPSQSNMGYISTLKTGDERRRAGPKDGAVASVTVSVDATGSVNVVGDSVPQGQGHQTVLAQVVADQLGLAPDDIAVALDTDTAKDGWSLAAGNYSNRFSPASVSAAHLAAERVRKKMAGIAATMLNAPAEDLRFKNGKILAAHNPDNAVPFYRVGGLAHWSPSSLPEGMDPGIRETAMWSAPELTPTSAKDEINTSLAYGFGFDFCGVEIDSATGVVRIDQYATAHDCGTILNPGMAEGQIRGSWASGIGATFYEEFAYGEDGSFLSGTFADYLVPSACEVPEFQLVHPTPTPSPYTRLGAKGIAEGNQYTTPACIANAVADALGFEDVLLPLAPAKVLAWIQSSERPPAEGTAPAKAEEGKPRIEGSGEVQVSATPESVWDIFLDPQQMAKIIPGCDRLEAVGDNRFRGDVMLGVGPIKGLFEVRLDLTDLDKPRSAKLVGSAAGPLGSSSGAGVFNLKPMEGFATLVEYSYSIQLSGKVAAVGGRLLHGAARQLIERFMAALARQAGGDVAAEVQSTWRALGRRLLALLGGAR